LGSNFLQSTNDKYSNLLLINMHVPVIEIPV